MQIMNFSWLSQAPMKGVVFQLANLIIEQILVLGQFRYFTADKEMVCIKYGRHTQP